jgi:hypothetical protein
MRKEFRSDVAFKSATTPDESAPASDVAIVGDKTAASTTSGAQTGKLGDIVSNVPHSTPAAVASQGGENEPATKTVVGGEKLPNALPPDCDGENHDQDNGDACPGVLPIIEREPPGDRIIVGGGGKLVVPREDIAADCDTGEELDLKELQSKKIRKPKRSEWIALNRASELPTRLLNHKPKPDGIEVEHYYVAPHLRSLIRGELKEVRVFVYYSFITSSFALMVVNVTIGNKWYESMQSLLNQPPKFFAEYAIRILSDRDKDEYRVKFKPMPGNVVWPTKSTEELFGEALGPERFINTPDHPVYAALIEGEELR